jgi:hypothetical protein
MYYPQGSKEPSGCMQALLISRTILGILLVPAAMIIIAVFTILLAFIALAASPLLALAVIGGALALLFGFARWESKRIDREREAMQGDDYNS